MRIEEITRKSFAETVQTHIEAESIRRMLGESIEDDEVAGKELVEIFESISINSNTLKLKNQYYPIMIHSMPSFRTFDIYGMVGNLFYIGQDDGRFIFLNQKGDKEYFPIKDSIILPKTGEKIITSSLFVMKITVADWDVVFRKLENGNIVSTKYIKRKTKFQIEE